MTVYRAFPASYEQSDAIVEAMTGLGVSWSELQDTVSKRAMRYQYHLPWPSFPRQLSHGLRDRADRCRSIRGEFVVFGHTVSDEQNRSLLSVAELAGDPHGWYTAFMELAMREHFQIVTRLDAQTPGQPWPSKRRLAEDAIARILGLRVLRTEMRQIEENALLQGRSA